MYERMWERPLRHLRVQPSSSAVPQHPRHVNSRKIDIERLRIFGQVENRKTKKQYGLQWSICMETLACAEKTFEYFIFGNFLFQMF